MDNKCKICGSEKQLVPGGTRKDGTTYDDFMGCPNWKSHPKKSGYSKDWPKPQEDSRNGILIEKIDEINERLDKLIQYVVTHLK